LKSFNRLFASGVLLAAIAIAACEETTTPPPPDPPPQIGVSRQFTRNGNFPEDTTTGLQSNNAFDVLVDSQGRTWISEQAGLSRFIGGAGDGTWNENNVLPNPKCRGMLEHNGKIWTGTWGGGVAVYDMTGDVWSILNVDSGLVNNMVGSIAAVGDSIYMATNSGASIYVDNDQIAMEDRWTTIPITDTEEGIVGILTRIISVVRVAHTPTRGMEVWFAPRMQAPVPDGEEANYGITVYREGQFQPAYYTTVNSDLAEPNVNDLYYDPDTDLFWLAFATQGVASLDVDGRTWTYYRQSNGLPSEVVYSVTKVGENIWVGTQGGVARMNSNGSWQGYGRSGGLPGDKVRRVYSNDPSELWACIIDGGVALLDP
jgi:ligand-binding sensor domain-containing protein